MKTTEGERRDWRGGPGGIGELETFDLLDDFSALQSSLAALAAENAKLRDVLGRVLDNPGHECICSSPGENASCLECSARSLLDGGK